MDMALELYGNMNVLAVTKLELSSWTAVIYMDGSSIEVQTAMVLTPQRSICDTW